VLHALWLLVLIKLLTPPFDLVAAAAGFSTLTRVIDVVGPYPAPYVETSILAAVR